MGSPEKILKTLCCAGEGPCLATFWVTRFWELLVVRIATGISLGGTMPLVFSLMADLFHESQRPTVAAGVQLALGLGLAMGQAIAAFAGAAPAPVHLLSSSSQMWLLLEMVEGRLPPICHLASHCSLCRWRFTLVMSPLVIFLSSVCQMWLLCEMELQKAEVQ